MFNLFKKQPSVTNLAWLGVDMHNHILPGIDDGSPDVASSTTYLKGLADLGIHTVHSTPHIFKSYHNNNRETITAAYNQVTQAAAAAGITLGHAAEYMMDEDFDVQGADCILPGNHILVEMSYLAESPHAEGYIYNLQARGLNPILAHPERYTFYHHDAQMLLTYKERGVLMQLNLLSVTGYYGKHVQKAAEALLKEGFYDLAGTDLHHEKHLRALTHAVKDGSLYTKIGKQNFKNEELFG